MPNIVNFNQQSAFTVSLNMQCRPCPVTAFSWCGFLIDMLDLSVSIDYSRFHETCEFVISFLNGSSD